MAVGVTGAEISNTLEYAFVKDIWNAPHLFGWLMSAFGVGMITAGLLIAGPLGGVDPKSLLVRGFAVFTFGGFAWALAPSTGGGGHRAVRIRPGERAIQHPDVYDLSGFDHTRDDGGA